MPGEIRRGGAAIDEAVQNVKDGGGGGFPPFIPNLFWAKDHDEKYLLFLNPISEIPQFDMITFIPTERGFNESTVSKTDPYFGERTDDFEETWDATAKVTNVAVAVELEPIVEQVGARKKPKGFRVATKDYTRKVLDEDGNTTEETEEMTTPVVGVVQQSPLNFFNVLKSKDDTEFAVNETPVKIVRIGEGANTTYDITGFEVEFDLDNLFQYLNGVSYLGDDLGDLEREIEKIEDPLEAAQRIGSVLLDKKLEELLDEERYATLFEGVTESMDRFNKKKKGRERKPAKARPSQRKSEPADTTDSESKPVKKAKKATVTSSSPVKERLAELQSRVESKKK